MGKVTILPHICYYCGEPLEKGKEKLIFFRWDDVNKQVLKVEVCEKCYQKNTNIASETVISST